MSRIINYKIVFLVISRNLFICAASLLLCVLLSLVYTEPFRPFLLSSIASLLLGVIFHLMSLKKRNDIKLQRREAYLIVTLSWFLVSIIGSLPYFFSNAIPNFIDAFFESVSGFTTTGSSILTDIESLPKSIIFWRSLTHWIGGIGIIMLVIIVMPKLHIGGYQLFTTESSLQEKIEPKIKTIGFRILMIYIVLTFAETILLLIGDMTLFESICHAFGTIATGGFSPKNSSISNYSPYIQYVIMAFMVLSGTNFVIHYYLLKKKFKKIRENEELRFYLTIILILGVTISATLLFKMHKPIEEAFREGFFQVISIITCTGYATADYLTWPTYAWMIIFFAMFLGGSTGSTAGGIKMARHLILFKNLKRFFYKAVSSHAIVSIRINKKAISEQTNNSILTFITLYLTLFSVGSIFLMIGGSDITTSCGAVITCMSGIGPGIGTVGPASNFAHLPEFSKILLSLLMLLGRLEIYAILILFTKAYWRI